MGGNEARAFMSWVVGGTSTSMIKQDKDGDVVHSREPKQFCTSSSACSSSASRYVSARSHSSTHDDDDDASTIYPEDSVSVPFMRREREKVEIVFIFNRLSFA
jgi:hypothetical protein